MNDIQTLNSWLLGGIFILLFVLVVMKFLSCYEPFKLFKSATYVTPTEKHIPNIPELPKLTVPEFPTKQTEELPNLTFISPQEIVEESEWRSQPRLL